MAAMAMTSPEKIQVSMVGVPSPDVTRCQETQKMEKQLKDLVEVQNRLECMAQGLWSCEEDESCGQGD